MKIFTSIMYASCIAFFSMFSGLVHADSVDDYLLKKNDE